MLHKMKKILIMIVYLDEDQQADPINEDQPQPNNMNTAMIPMKEETESNQVIIIIIQRALPDNADGNVEMQENNDPINNNTLMMQSTKKRMDMKSNSTIMQM